ncbi:unnamed protein product [Prorocentrum cordatum]|uniref:Uncharacterized protein n=1 Tax=Prorocentrum cordatum TaxID=2364126 RepID=A0ABN9QHI0_9DINO|nr:unnamed protein product [Polarella glacialis]
MDGAGRLADPRGRLGWADGLPGCAALPAPVPCSWAGGRGGAAPCGAAGAPWVEPWDRRGLGAEVDLAQQEAVVRGLQEEMSRMREAVDLQQDRLDAALPRLGRHEAEVRALRKEVAALTSLAKRERQSCRGWWRRYAPLRGSRARPRGRGPGRSGTTRRSAAPRPRGPWPASSCPCSAGSSRIGDLQQLSADQGCRAGALEAATGTAGAVGGAGTARPPRRAQTASEAPGAPRAEGPELGARLSALAGEVRSAAARLDWLEAAVGAGGGPEGLARWAAQVSDMAGTLDGMQGRVASIDQLLHEVQAAAEEASRPPAGDELLARQVGNLVQELKEVLPHARSQLGGAEEPRGQRGTGQAAPPWRPGAAEVLSLHSGSYSSDFGSPAR